MSSTPAMETPTAEASARQQSREWFRGPVLVATDGLDASRHALEMARLLGARGVTVDVVSVLEPLVIPAPEVPVNWAEVDDARRGELRKRVKEQVAEVMGEVEPAHIEAIFGLVVPEIAGLARARRAELIITGLRPHGTFERVFVRGETPLRLARAAHTPVLVVPTHVTHLPRVVVIATDLDEASVHAARLARPLLAEATTVHLVHVRAFETVPADLGGTAWGQLYSQLTGDHFDQIVAAIECGPDVRIEARTLTGHPVDELIEYTEHVGAELLVSGYRKRVLMDRITGPRSVAERVYRGTTCPMLLVPETAVEHTTADVLVQSEVFTEPDEWTVALSAFSVRNAGRAAQLEIDTADHGEQAQVTGFPLRGIDYEHNTDTLQVMFGAAGGGLPHLEHAIEHPRSVEIQRGGDGRDVALRVAHGDGTTLLTFYNGASTPPARE